MARIVQSPLALDDLQAIWEYIAADSPAAADATIRKLSGTFDRLAENPLIGEQQAAIRPDLRRFVVGSYLIFYQPIDGGIRVARVFHGARRYEDLI